jgi:regulator of replication initiation timing
LKIELEDAKQAMDIHANCNKLIEELRSDKSKLENKVEDCIKEKGQLKIEKDYLTDRFKRKEDYWSSLYMKMFTAADKNEGLAVLFRTEGVQMRS